MRPNRRLGSVTLEEEGKCEAFLGMPSDGMRPNRRLGSVTLEEEGKCEAFLGMPSEDMRPNRRLGSVTLEEDKMIDWNKEETMSPGFEKAFNCFLNTLSDQEIPLHGVTIIKDNKLLAERAFGTFTPTRIHRMYSVAKSFASLAIGCLAEEGKLSLDDCICDYFPELIPEEDVSELLKGLTIRQMLTMTTCYSKSTYGADESRTKSYFVAKADHMPGSVFYYDTSASFILGALTEKLTGMKILDYLRTRCLDEIGFSKEAYIITDNEGVSDCGSGMMCSMRDMAKVALLCLNNGKYNGKSLLPEAYLREAFKKHTPTDLQDSAEERHGYGYMFWKTRYDGFCMYGMGGQFAACFPELNLVFVTIADTKENVGGVQLLWRAFYDHLYPYFDKSVAAKKSERATCFVPTAGTLHSPYEEKISGKPFKCQQNDAGILSFMLDLEKSVFIFRNAEKTFTIPVGRNEWIEYDFNETVRAAASGNWISDTNFAIKIYTFAEELSHVFFEIGFHDKTTTLKMKASGDVPFSRYKNKVAIAAQFE